MSKDAKAWWKKTLEWARDASAVSNLTRLAIPIAGSGITVLWSWFANEPAVTIWVYGLLVLGALVYILNGFHSWKTQKAQNTTSLPKQESTPFPPEVSQDKIEREDLIGSWFVTNNDETLYMGLWTFRHDGTASVKACTDDGHRPHSGPGKWKMEEACVRITWDKFFRPDGKPCEDTFARPINPILVHGDCWDGKVNRWRASKLCGPLTV